VTEWQSDRWRRCWWNKSESRLCRQPLKMAYIRCVCLRPTHAADTESKPSSSAVAETPRAASW